MASQMMKEFRAFAVRGNVVDLAVGVIIGGAFGKIVDSLVNDIVMPLISTLLGGRIDFTNLFIVLGTVQRMSPEPLMPSKKRESLSLPTVISSPSQSTSSYWHL